ncbi:hypothetical protein OGH69_01410 [Flavobacterium sp. MFBS3-15]|uniref:hypothetical protein n=1 Tax=Flavobacterium sp. MFBS3-15 TaxID=2989816 RepID=UPI0022363574|nr:hypothetical protein [Flavobacterium sp. MFBS3-15]MCW4467613.1 hypothetical protein [Flavobacterium sp. MFBS3-15]
MTIALPILACFCVNAQESAAYTRFTGSNKGKFFISWGGNREHYTRSDIRFTGSNYDFTLHNTKAHDVPKGMHVDYINPARMTIPQTNFKIGYYFSDHYSVAIGVDHMKYVVSQQQCVPISGTISIPGSQFYGSYHGESITIIPEFLAFEHTDGLNYVNVELARTDDVGQYLFSVNGDIVQINFMSGVSGGFLYPRTDATLLGKQRNNEFHVAGYGAAAKGGANLTFFKYFFIQAELKAGYINLTDIRTTNSRADKAIQQFGFLQTNISVGALFRLY